jgi:hypothetical protein
MRIINKFFGRIDGKLFDETYNNAAGEKQHHRYRLRPPIKHFPVLPTRAEHESRAAQKEKKREE